jgi:hypothetical protein
MKHNIQFERICAPINKYTFTSRKIKKWVETNVEGIVLNLFAGKIILDCNEIRNDINKEMPANYHYEAVDLVELFIRTDKKVNTILLDPPYSYRKSMEYYKGHKNSRFKRVKDMLKDILNKNGCVITFGYHSLSMGKRRGFEIEKILLISHGGAIHDTIATKERLINET